MSPPTTNFPPMVTLSAIADGGTVTTYTVALMEVLLYNGRAMSPEDINTLRDTGTPTEKPSMLTGVEAWKGCILVGGILTIVFAWAAAVFVGTLIVVGIFVRDQDFFTILDIILVNVAQGQFYGCFCTLLPLAFSLFLPGYFFREFIAGKETLSIVIFFIILSVFIVSVGGCFFGALAALEWFH